MRTAFEGRGEGGQRSKPRLGRWREGQAWTTAHLSAPHPSLSPASTRSSQVESQGLETCTSSQEGSSVSLDVGWCPSDCAQRALPVTSLAGILFPCSPTRWSGRMWKMILTLRRGGPYTGEPITMPSASQCHHLAVRERRVKGGSSFHAWLSGSQWVSPTR